MNLLEQLMDSPVAWTILSVIAIAGFVYAIICQHVNKEKKEITYIKESNSLILEKKTKYEKLSIAYDGKMIESLCVTKLILWNSGNRTLNNTDIVESKELTIIAEETSEILDVEIIACSEETNKFSVFKVDAHNVKVVFDYVDSKDGIAIQIIHTGTGESISLNCKIKGGKPIKNHINEAFPNMIRKVINSDRYEKSIVVICVTSIVMLLGMALLLTLSIFIPDLQNIIFTTTEKVTSTTKGQQDSLVFLAITFWISSLMLVALYIPVFKRLFSVGIPHKLKNISKEYN